MTTTVPGLRVMSADEVVDNVQQRVDAAHARLDALFHHVNLDPDGLREIRAGLDHQTTALLAFRTKAEAAEARVQVLESDFRTLGVSLAELATAHSLCGVYEECVDDLNASLRSGMRLPHRSRWEVNAHYQGQITRPLLDYEKRRIAETLEVDEIFTDQIEVVISWEHESDGYEASTEDEAIRRYREDHDDCLPEGITWDMVTFDVTEEER